METNTLTEHTKVLRLKFNVCYTRRRTMGLKNAKEGKLLYHLTELKNLESIIDSGLVPRKILRENTVTFGDVADPEIIRKREGLGLDESLK